MQNSQAYDIKPSTPVTPRTPFHSDSSCFSPIADQTAPPPPICGRCGQKPSIGGAFQELDSGYPSGQITGTVEFLCEDHGQKIFQITVANLAQWTLFRQVAPGVYRVKKKTQAERVNAGS